MVIQVNFKLTGCAAKRCSPVSKSERRWTPCCAAQINNCLGIGFTTENATGELHTDGVDVRCRHSGLLSWKNTELMPLCGGEPRARNQPQTTPRLVSHNLNYTRQTFAKTGYWQIANIETKTRSSLQIIRKHAIHGINRWTRIHRWLAHFKATAQLQLMGRLKTVPH